MSGSVKLKLPAGGSKTISAPDSASDETITLPAGTGGTLVQTDSSGKVGIGGESFTVTSMLHVYKSLATADLALQSAGASGRKYILQSKTDGSLAFFDNNASTERMRIDSSGRVTMPNQPAFRVGHGTTVSYPANSTVIFAGNEYDRGNNYNNTTGKFTVPVDGVYFFTATIRYSPIPTITQWIRSHFMKNGGHTEFLVGDPIQGQSTSGDIYSSTTATAIIELVAGDYITVFCANNSGNNMIIDGSTAFSGYLVG